MQHFTLRDGVIDPELFLAALQRHARNFHADLVHVVHYPLLAQPSKAS